MDHLVAVQLTMRDGSSRFVLTLGDVFESAEKLFDVVADYIQACGESTPVARVRLCDSLREAAESPDAPQFYEALAAASRFPEPVGDRREGWRRRTRKEMLRGAHMHSCGRPN